MCAHCYWGGIAPWPSQQAELRNVCTDTNIHIATQLYFYPSLYIHICIFI